MKIINWLSTESTNPLEAATKILFIGACIVFIGGGIILLIS